MTMRKTVKLHFGWNCEYLRMLIFFASPFGQMHICIAMHMVMQCYAIQAVALHLHWYREDVDLSIRVCLHSQTNKI
jgi:hypothetical protein